MHQIETEKRHKKGRYTWFFNLNPWNPWKISILKPRWWSGCFCTHVQDLKTVEEEPLLTKLIVRKVQSSKIHFYTAVEEEYKKKILIGTKVLAAEVVSILRWLLVISSLFVSLEKSHLENREGSALLGVELYVGHSNEGINPKGVQDLTLKC